MSVPATEFAAMGVHTNGCPMLVHANCPNELLLSPAPPVATVMTDQFPGGALVTGAKLAVMLCGPNICTKNGLAEVGTIDPDQFTNRYPEAAVAVSAGVTPASTKPPPVTVPPSGGLANAVNIYCVLNVAV